MTITQERLKELLHYDPGTGRFTWTNPPKFGGIPIGARAGTSCRHGYRRIKIGGKSYREHRLAFLYMLGVDPPDQVDHINRDTRDNRWSNLRLATNSENKMNSGMYRSNRSGYRGVSYNKQCKKWVAYGQRDGELRYLGLHSTAEKAAAVAEAWRGLHFKI